MCRAFYIAGSENEVISRATNYFINAYERGNTDSFFIETNGKSVRTSSPRDVVKFMADNLHCVDSVEDIGLDGWVTKTLKTMLIDFPMEIAVAIVGGTVKHVKRIARIDKQKERYVFGHLRKSTHGNKFEAHGWNIGGYTMVHNGILDEYGSDDVTDSEAFFRMVLKYGRGSITAGAIQQAFRGGTGVILAKKGDELHIISLNQSARVYYKPGVAISITSWSDIHANATNCSLILHRGPSIDLGKLKLHQPIIEEVIFKLPSMNTQGEYKGRINNAYAVFNTRTMQFTKVEPLNEETEDEELEDGVETSYAKVEATD